MRNIAIIATNELKLSVIFNSGASTLSNIHKVTVKINMAASVQLGAFSFFATIICAIFIFLSGLKYKVNNTIITGKVIRKTGKAYFIQVEKDNPSIAAPMAFGGEATIVITPPILAE